LWASGRAKGKGKAAMEINRRLDELRASALSHWQELMAVRTKVTADEVKTMMLGMASGQETLIAYFRVQNENFNKRVGVNRKAGTAKTYRNALNHVSKFVIEKYRITDIPFTALDRSFIEKYDLHLRTECKLSPGTITVMTIRLGTVINHAIAAGIITTNPFAGYERTFPTPKQKYIPREELNRLMTTPLATSSQYTVRDLFLFSCYTGISYGDMRRLTERDLWMAEDGTTWIKSKRVKTGIDYQVPLLDLPLQILERYRDTAPDGRLLPVYSISHMNYTLKEIARICDISGSVHFHRGRHTYASVVTLSQGVPIETVSRMLGHKGVKMTERYAITTVERIGDEIRDLGERIAGKFKVAI
jgi:integrase